MYQSQQQQQFNPYTQQAIPPPASLSPHANESVRSPTHTSEKPAPKNPLTDLMDSEKIYVDELGAIIRRVAGAWSRSNFPPPLLDAMFRAIESIYRVNRSFVAKLKEIGPNPSSPKALGDLLMRWIEDLTPAYTTYSQRFMTAFDYYGPVQSNTSLEPILSQLPPQTVSGQQIPWTLDSLFLLPYTRLKYYKKLYARLLKNTQEGRSDWRLLVGANERLEGLLEAVKSRLNVNVVEEDPDTRGTPEAPPPPSQLPQLPIVPTSALTPQPIAAIPAPPALPPKTAEEQEAEARESFPSSGVRSSGNSSLFSNGNPADRSSSTSATNSFNNIPSPTTPSSSSPLVSFPPAAPSTPGMNQTLRDIEMRLDAEKTVDLFTMQPRKVRLQISPPALPFQRKLRVSLDVMIHFTPSCQPHLPVSHRRGHIFILSDLFLICERMAPQDRALKVAAAEDGSQGPDLWLCYPPLAGKHLKVMRGQLDTEVWVDVMRKERFVLLSDSRDKRESIVSCFEECISFANSTSLAINTQTAPLASAQPPHPGPNNLRKSLMSPTSEYSRTSKSSAGGGGGYSPNVISSYYASQASGSPHSDHSLPPVQVDGGSLNLGHEDYFTPTGTSQSPQHYEPQPARQQQSDQDRNDSLNTSLGNLDMGYMDKADPQEIEPADSNEYPEVPPPAPPGYTAVSSPVSLHNSLPAVAAIAESSGQQEFVPPPRSESISSAAGQSNVPPRGVSLASSVGSAGSHSNVVLPAPPQPRQQFPPSAFNQFPPPRQASASPQPQSGYGSPPQIVPPPRGTSSISRSASGLSQTSQLSQQLPQHSYSQYDEVPPLPQSSLLPPHLAQQTSFVNGVHSPISPQQQSSSAFFSNSGGISPGPGAISPGGYSSNGGYASSPDVYTGSQPHHQLRNNYNSAPASREPSTGSQYAPVQRSRSTEPFPPQTPGGSFVMPSAMMSDTRSMYISGNSPIPGQDPTQDDSPPPSPTADQPTTLSGPAVISAAMKCKVFLKQQHAQWKSLGSARLKLYHQQSNNVKQVVVEADNNSKKMLISTIVLTDAVERVGKTGVAIEISDQGARTGIIYMLQLRNETSATGLFDSLLQGTNRGRRM